MRKVFLICILFVVCINVGFSQLIEGHTAAIWGTAISSDNGYIITSSTDKTIKIWNAKTSRFVKTLRGHTGAVTKCAISPDGKYLITGSLDLTVRVWNFPQGRILHVFRGFKKNIYSLAVSSDSRLIAISDNSGKIYFKHARSGRNRKIIRSSGQRIVAIDFSLDKRFFAVLNSRNEIKIYNAFNFKVIKKIKVQRYCSFIKFTPDSKYLGYTRSHDLVIRNINSGTQKEIRVGKVILNFDFSPDGRFVFLGLNSYRGQKTLHLASLKTLKVLKLQFKSEDKQITTTRYSPNGEYVISSNLDSRLKVWKIKGKEYNDFINCISLPIKDKQDILNKKLIIAVLNNNYDRVKTLLNKGASPNARKTLKRAHALGKSALMISSINNNIQITSLLLNKGAKINLLTHYGETALMFACEKGCYNIVKLLLKRGAKVNIQANLMGGRATSAVFKACENGSLKILKLLVKYRADIHKPNKNRITPLIVAAENGSVDVIRFLLRRRVNINYMSIRKTALMHAAIKNKPKAIQTLLKFRANKMLYDYSGNTALHLAAYSGSIAAMRVLIRNGLNVNTRIFKRVGEGYTNGNTPLISAINNGQFNSVKFLVNMRANPYLKNRRGQNAFIVAKRFYRRSRNWSSELRNLYRKVYYFLKKRFNR